MFSYIFLNNFKSMTNIRISFCAANKPKSLILIYGENGSGKTNIVEAFALLKTLSDSITNQMRLAGIISRLRDNNEDGRHEFTSLIKKRAMSYDIDEIFNTIRSQNTSEDIILEYGFQLDGKNGFYRLVYGHELKEETLYFTLNRKAGYLYKIIKGGEPFISDLSFVNADYKKEMIEKIDKYWGKHTLISIINHDIGFMNQTYMSGSLSEPLKQVIKFFDQYSVQLKRFDSSEGVWATRFKALFDLDEGDIPHDAIVDLDKKTKLVRLILTSLYSDIKDVYYMQRSENGNNLIHYKLFVKKIIGGVIRNIDFNNESSGTKNLLRIILPVSEAVMGNVSIIDEADTGMHDLLFNNLIERATENLKGQLIMTTHNTTLLNSIQKDAVHFLVVDALGNKKFVSISDFPIRTQQNHNIQDRYLQGIYDGVPSIGYLDFNEFHDLLEN